MIKKQYNANLGRMEIVAMSPDECFIAYSLQATRQKTDKLEAFGLFILFGLMFLALLVDINYLLSL